MDTTDKVIIDYMVSTINQIVGNNRTTVKFHPINGRVYLAKHATIHFDRPNKSWRNHIILNTTLHGLHASCNKHYWYPDRHINDHTAFVEQLRRIIESIE